MSYSQVVTWRCDGCGDITETDNLLPPKGWMEPARSLNMSQGPHLCLKCANAAQSSNRFIGRVIERTGS